MNINHDLKQRINEVLSAMPSGQRWKEGGAVEWGPPGNKDRALYLAARIGHTFDPNCKSCDSDLWLVLKQASK